MGKVSFTFKDHAKQSSRFELDTDTVNAGNIAAITSQMGALKTAVSALTRGLIKLEVLNAITTENSGSYATDPEAGREMKWLLRLEDSVTNEVLTRELPTADFSSGHVLAGTEEADMTHADWVSLKGAIDGNYNNPETGNSLLLTGAKRVGRNL